MEVFYFIEYLQEFKDLYTKEEYKELLALWREDYNKYLRGLIGEDQLRKQREIKELIFFHKHKINVCNFSL